MDSKALTSQLNQQTTLLLTGKIQFLSPAEAWHNGTNIQKSIRIHPEMCRGWIMAQVGRLCKDMDATKTLSTDEELLFTCRAIITEHPTLKLEEIAVCFDMIRMGKFGKLYGRLKTAEILECLRQYEGEIRAEIMETKVKAMHIDHTQSMMDTIDPAIIAKFISDKNVEMKKDGIGSRLRRDLDAYAEYDPSLLDKKDE